MPTSESQVKFSVRAHPNAARNEVVGFIDRVLQIKISSPPIKNKANKELIAFLSQILDISKSRIIILKGHNSKNKVIAVQGLSQEELEKRLLSAKH
ncbi:DUF167 domain-containing protein [Chloroflexota bacterium]